MDINQQPTIPTPDPQPSLHIQKRRSYRLLAIFISIGIVCIVGAIGSYIWYKAQLDAVDATSQDSVQVIVSTGETVTTVSQELEEKGLIKNAFALQVYHRLEKRDDIRAGVYTFSKQQTAVDILHKMQTGDTDEARITFKPGETVLNARQVLKKAGYSDKVITNAFEKQYTKYPMMMDRPAGTTVEGFILGETYSYTKRYTVENILDRPFSLLQQYITDEKLEDAFKKQGLTLYQGIILASIIQKEVSKQDDMALVSSVFHNRLKKNMPLGSDVTAAYGVQIQGKKTSVVEAVSIDTPYNTRIHTGLPPAPIASPGMRALRAAANPADSQYLYFVAGDDGKTYFATTNEEHERNTKEHCDQLCKL